MARLMPPVSPYGPWPCSGTSTPTELALAAMTRLVALRSTTLTASSTIPTGSPTCSSPPPWEVINYEPRNPIESGFFQRSATPQSVQAQWGVENAWEASSNTTSVRRPEGCDHTREELLP